jgi:hypothetical protein
LQGAGGPADNSDITAVSKIEKRPALEALLVQLLLGEDDAAGVAGHQLTEEQLWDPAVQRAEAWKIVPQFLARIQALRLKPSSQAGATLRRSYLAAYGRSAQRVAQAIPALNDLQQAGIPVAAFKGLASIAMLYGDARQRTIQDVDILIRRADLERTLLALERLGFRPQGDTSMAEYLHFVANAPGFSGNQAIALYDGNGGEIDLHWDLRGSGLSVDEILKRTVQVDLGGHAVPVVSAADGLMLTAHHAIRENLAVASVCRDLLDIRLWCGRCPVQCGHASSVLTSVYILVDYDPAGAAAKVAAEFERQLTPHHCRAARELSRIFHYQLEHGPLDNDVLFLVHSRPWLLVLRGLSAGWSGYRKSMRAVETQLEREVPLHRRLVALARSIPGREGLRLARQLARVKFG